MREEVAYQDMQEEKSREQQQGQAQQATPDPTTKGEVTAPQEQGAPSPDPTTKQDIPG